MPPHFLRTLVGAPTWEACWGPFEENVGQADVPPYALLRVAFHVALTMEQALIGQATDAQVQAAVRTADVASMEQRKRQRT